MSNQVTHKQTTFARLSKCFHVYLFVIVLFPFISLAQEKGNTDIISTVNGEIIKCKIRKINNNNISYQILRHGADTKGTIDMTQVIKYFYKQKWYDVNTSVANENNVNSARVNNSPIEKARNFILTENINEAVAAYSGLAKNSTDPELIMEYAYALALGGFYDASFIYLDRIRNNGFNSVDVNYYTSQVFALMGNNDLASEFWSPSMQNKAPGWISSKATTLLEKFKKKLSGSTKTNRDELIANFRHANQLASQNLYFQSIALFQEITTLYPNEYLPYVGYSISLEKAGAFQKSSQALTKAIALLSNSAEDKEKKQLMEQQLYELKLKAASFQKNNASQITQNYVPENKRVQTVAHIGGMVSPHLTNINLRYGFYIANAGSGSIDFGMLQNKNADNTFNNTYFHIGVTTYERMKKILAGVGIQFNFENGGTTTYNLKLSGGLSFVGKSKRSSLDIFIDVLKNTSATEPLVLNVSLGTSFYFGRGK